MLKDENVEVLVIGKSGVGKSEFILSFVDDELRKKIPASDRGQTTRNTARYNIHFDDNYTDNKMKFKLKTKQSFVESRMEIVVKYIREMGLTAFTNNYDRCIRGFRTELIHDKAFFNCIEFGENISNEIDNDFLEKFNKNFWEEMLKIDLEKEEDSKKFYNHFKIFFEEVYVKCKQIFDNDVKDTEISLNGEVGIQKFLKAKGNTISYTSIIENVTIDVKGTDSYIKNMNDIGISCLSLIDTYGLDHVDSLDEEVLRIRYYSLFRDEFPNIKTIFYLIDASITDSATYLKTSIPLIFDVAPSMMPFIIFTKADLVEENALSDINAYKATEFSDGDGDIFNFKLQQNINKSGLSFTLIDKKFKFITENRIGYCSAEKPKNEYKKEKNKAIIKLLEIIKNKSYLGDSYIPIDLLKSDEVKSILTIEKLFNDKYINEGTYGRTKYAIKDRFSYGILGFCGVANDNLWSHLLSKDLDKRFKNISTAIEYIKANLPVECDKDSVSVAIEQLFTEFSKQLYNNGQDDVKKLNSKYYSNQIIEKMHLSLKPAIDNYVNSDGHILMNGAYAFGSIDNNTKKEIQEIINDAYINWFIQECRKHNARLKAKEINGNMTYEEKENAIKDYFDKYDKDANDEDKQYFEEQLENI